MSILKQTLLKNMSVEEPIEIPAHKLIVAIRENPALYDKSHAHYNNKKVKAALWNKIAADKVFPKEWPNWSKTEKTTAVCYMQKRWGNLRTTFAREVKKTIKRKQEGLYGDSLVSWKYYRSMLFMKNFMTILLDGTPLVFEKDALSESNMQDDQSEEFSIKHEENEDFELFEVQYLEDNSNDSEYSSSQNVSAPEFIKINNEAEMNDTDTEDEVTPIKRAKKVHEGSVKSKASSSNDNYQIDGTDTEIEVPPKKKPSKDLFRKSIHRSPENKNNSNFSFHNGDSYRKSKTSESRQSVLPILSQDANKLDQDIYFAMSLVPLLKELSPGQRLQAQIDILMLFKKYKNDDK